MPITINGDVSHVGLVLGRSEYNGYDDSDFVAVVWDPKAEAIAYVEYASTRYAGYGHATIDADTDTVKKAEAYLARKLYELALDKANQLATTPVPGRTVKSLTTRGKNVGVEGIVMWRGEKKSRHGTWSYGFRVGIKCPGDDRLRYLDADRVEVVDVPTVDQTALWHAATAEAARHHWSVI